MKLKPTLISILIILTGCQKEESTLSVYASDTFYVENAGASMRVLVEGNTASRVFILFVHGGPGAGAYIYNTDYISKNIENKYALIYWDQRNSGASQGNSNGAYLKLGQITDDLKKVVLVIKERYGQDIELFLMSHSFGGLVASDFLTKGDNQNLIKGYINIDGSHNYPLNNTLSRDMLLNTGFQEVANYRYTAEWIKIIDFCQSHPGNFTFKESNELITYASQAENYIGVVTKIRLLPLLFGNSVINHYPLTSMLVNLLFSENADINKEIAKKEFSSTLYRITIPALLLYGRYDFTCPPELGEDFYSRIGSTEKKMVISPISGHNLMIQDEVLFSNEVVAFIEKFR